MYIDVHKAEICTVNTRYKENNEARIIHTLRLTILALTKFNAV